MYKCKNRLIKTNAKIDKCMNVKMYKYINVLMLKCININPHMYLIDKCLNV